MRLKIIERRLPLDQVYNILLKSIQPKNPENIRSYHSKNHLLIVVLNSKKTYFIIRVSQDDDFHRTYLSVLALNSKQHNMDKFFKREGNSILFNLFKLLKDKNKKGLGYHLKKIPGINLRENKKVLFKNVETRIINKLFRILSRSFDYFDKLLKFPFSNTQIDGSWIYWERIYDPFIRKIEKRIKKLNNTNIKTFRNYDFAGKTDLYPRIFELIVIERKQIDKLFEEDYPNLRTKREITLFKNDKPVNESYMFNLRISFIYCNKRFKSMKLMEFLKVLNEIKNYSEKIQSRIKKCNRIFPQMIIISFFGYEKKVINYLRKHIYHEIDYIIPIFILPPINNETWHNFNKDEGLTQIEKEAKRKLKKLIKINNRANSFSKFKSSDRKDKYQYQELRKQEKITKNDAELLKAWTKILIKK
ncbi:MAG: hypothetical protein ACFFEY_18090 [Candidatus Thorarchaeota archaeon]